MLTLFKNTKLFDSISKHALGLLLFLLPLFFLPVVGFGSASAKYAILYIFTAIALVAYMIARLGDKKLVLPKKSQVISLAALAASALLAAIFTGRFADSFIGSGFESTTALSTILFVVLAILSSVYSREERTVKTAIKLIIASTLVLLAYQIIRLFAPDNFLNFGEFTGPYGNLIGKWNDVAIVAGAVVISLYVALRKYSRKTLPYIVAAGIAALLILNIASFALTWWTVVLIVAAFVIIDSVQGKKAASPYSWNLYHTIGAVFVALVVVHTLISVQSVRLNSKGQLLRPNLYNIVQVLPNSFGGVPNEVRPGISTSFSILAKELRVNPVFGAGPNRFVESWVKNKPLEIGQTQYWATDFSFSVGYIPTLFVTTGIVGILAIVYFIFNVIKSAARLIRNNSRKTEDTIISLITVYLLILMLIYVPATTLIVYFFFGVGYIFSKDTPMMRTSSSKKSAKYVRVTLLLVAVTTLVTTGSVLAREYMSVRYYNKAITAVTIDKNIDSASNYLDKAVKSRARDTYYRGQAELALLKAQVIVSQGTENKKTLSEEARTASLREVTLAKEYADKAIAVNPSNYLNYQFAGSVYQVDAETSQKALGLYTKGLELNPLNPNAYFAIARNKSAAGDNQGALDALKKTLEVGPLYTDALLSAAQFSFQDKKNDETVSLLVRAYQSDRSRSDILLSLATLQAGELKNQKAAIETLEYAVGTNPQYLNGRYALATLYAEIEKYEDAANLLVGIVKIDNTTEVTLNPLIEKLRAGKNPFKVQSEPVVQATTTTTVTEN